MSVQTYGFEVHARRRGKKIVFRIWDRSEDIYATKVLTSERAARERLIEIEIAAFKQMIETEAPRRVASAKEDGFESSFVTTGELDDPWKEDGKPIVRVY